MTIILSPEVQAKAERIPDIAQRLERFINDQYALEQWRARQTQAIATAANQNIGENLVCWEGHWVATGELPADFDLEHFIEEQREQRIHEMSGP